MLVQLLVIAGVTLFGIQHSGISALRIKSRIINRFGKKGYSRIFSITSILTLVISIYLMSFSDWLYFLTNPELLNPLLLITGILIIIIGIVIASLASRQISVSTVADMRSDRKPELISDGIYAKVRHPMYLSTILMFFGLALVYPFLNVTLYCLSMSSYILVGTYFEERKLILYYGDEYLNYMKTTGFLLPKFSSSKK
jgi:protein-S-isoprenylcysteine O-methyltransferase Ste14